MASVIPNTRVIPHSQMTTVNNQSVAQDTNESSPMFVKAKKLDSTLAKTGNHDDFLADETQKPLFVKHVGQPDKKQGKSSLKALDSPDYIRKKEQDEIEAQLKDIKPRYSDTKNSDRPQTAKPVPASQALLS